MPELRHAGASLRYEEFGHGYPVLAFAPGGLRSRMDRWAGNPARPDLPPVFPDPRDWLARHYRIITLDQRNAGLSRAPVDSNNGWHSFMADYLALLDHLGVGPCHLLGACIGVSFALQLCVGQPGRFTAAVLQNPIGLVDGNRPVVDKLFSDWQADVSGRADIEAANLPGFRSRLFGDFVFSVTREQLRSCLVPMLLLPGSDDIHPGAISDEIARLAPNIAVLDPWKGPDHLASTAERVERFLARHDPAPTG